MRASYVENWLARSADFTSAEGLEVDDLLPAASLARRCGVVVDVMAFLALDPVEREALAAADAYMHMAAVDELWADETGAEFVKGLRDGR